MSAARPSLPSRVRLTPPMRRALRALDRQVLRQYEDLYRRDGVQWRTLRSLMKARPDRPALAQQVDLRPGAWLKSPYYAFYRLTDAGEKLRREIGK